MTAACHTTTFVTTTPTLHARPSIRNSGGPAGLRPSPSPGPRRPGRLAALPLCITHCRGPTTVAIGVSVCQIVQCSFASMRRRRPRSYLSVTRSREGPDAASCLNVALGTFVSYPRLLKWAALVLFAVPLAVPPCHHPFLAREKYGLLSLFSILSLVGIASVSLGAR